jgi:YD repeat-containing protein
MLKNNVVNKLETVTIDWLDPKHVAAYHYDDAGMVERVVNFNGTITDYYYDNANRLTALENRKSGSDIISSYYFS